MQQWIPNQAGDRTDAAASCVRRREFGVFAVSTGLGSLSSASWCAPRESGITAPALQRARHEFDDLATSAARLGLHERLAFINDWVNQLVDQQPDDPDRDTWATPYETLARGAGDCEDSAIAKFFLLRASGVPTPALRLLYTGRRPLETPPLRRVHMVATARQPFEDPWVLDSINVLIVPLSQRDDLVPVFSFDEQQLWPRVDAQPLPPARSELRPWRELLGRWHAQTH
ncbi:hypothetical protein [Variovorax sp. YR752]|uniref:hypothetical protein n=1 Tax=Variovorax sp. YR752 TaxID=1884383 RepID=UPI003137E6E2